MFMCIYWKIEEEHINKILNRYVNLTKAFISSTAGLINRKKSKQKKELKNQSLLIYWEKFGEIHVN